MLTISQLSLIIGRLATNDSFPIPSSELDEYIARFKADDEAGKIPSYEDVFHFDLWRLVYQRVRELRQEHRERAHPLYPEEN